MDVKLRIDEVLKNKNMTQVDLSKRVNKSKIEVNYWCMNKNQPFLDTLSEIEKVLKVRIADLISE
jgi:transcriptional regulator with XRE-family HTH domain